VEVLCPKTRQVYEYSDVCICLVQLSDCVLLSAYCTGPVSIKQEKTLGPVLEFLKSTSHDGLLGNGTASSPLKIVFMDV
jgi:hypothetical protein